MHSPVRDRQEHLIGANIGWLRQADALLYRFSDAVYTATRPGFLRTRPAVTFATSWNSTNAFSRGSRRATSITMPASGYFRGKEPPSRARTDSLSDPRL